ncbi:hypothetical protein GCM10009639_20850 [Kitasatospora putterlickiae]|uniref:Uncharacterized protein n=1 Tax=Kitasatospora putterlickiae TaxID=221725 RepID=A0ABN1XVG3_9ACTN
MELTGIANSAGEDEPRERDRPRPRSRRPSAGLDPWAEEPPPEKGSVLRFEERLERFT